MKRMIVFCLALLTALSLAACGNEPAGKNDTPTVTDMTQMYEKVQQTVQMPEMLKLDAGMMLDYCGIRQEDVKQAVVAICADSLRTDEIWLLEATDEAAASRLMELANKRLQKKGEESKEYSPQQYAVVEKAQLVQKGNFIALFVSPDSEAMANVF
ncbi:MAG: DUF4358 domain-containing protein [Oscillospiraceae bacterium]|nr:DUF4358 domain-containing protein [Oscillospiraceae bacterium]